MFKLSTENNIDMLYPINVILVTFFIVINLMDYITTVIFYSKGGVELNVFIAGHLQAGNYIQLFIIKVVFVSLFAVGILLFEKFIERRYPDNYFINSSPIAFTIVFIAINVILTVVVLNNLFLINSGAGLFEGFC